MPDRIPFSIGLEAVPSDALQQINNAIGTTVGSIINNAGLSSSQELTKNGMSFMGSTVGLSEPTVEDGVYITDESLKQVYIEMTVFQSFPVQMEDGKYTFVTDNTSTTDGAGTNTGGLAHNCNGGQCGFCDNFDEGILNSQLENVKNFKVGASIGHSYGTQYLQKFYPEVKWSSGDFGTLKRAGLIIAEMVIPTSSTQGKPVRCTLVDNGPFHKWAIDVMGSFCLLDEVKDLFRIKAVKADGSAQVVDGNSLKFPFADKQYDYINGEIPGFSPTAIKSWLNPNCLYNGVKTSPFKRYYGECKAGPKRSDNGHSMIRVKFYIDPTKRDEAEKKVGKKLPDDLFKPNYSGETVNIGGTPSYSSNELVDNASIWERIYKSGVEISNLLVQRAAANPGVKLYKNGRELKKSSENGLSVVSTAGTDCSAGAFWILVNAGLIEPTSLALSPPNTGYMRAYKNGWPSNLKLAAGIKVVPVSIENVQPGDLILWDRNKDSNNHLLIYAGPGKKFDFGNDAAIKKQQPVNGSHLSSSPQGSTYYVYSYAAWRFLPENSTLS